MGAYWKAGERRACSACGVECIGAKSRHGAVGPIEEAPNPKGNVLLYKDVKGGLRYAVLPKTDVTDPKKRADAAAIALFVSENMMVRRMNHFATCPRSEEFRRGRAIPEEEKDAGATDGA